MSELVLVTLAGMVTGLSLIVAIGAQNAFVLRQGIVREHVGVVVALCIVSDALLIIAGTAGVGAIISEHPALLVAFKVLGAAYLIWFGVRSLLAARRAHGLTAREPRSKGSVVATTLALTWLNPHVYLDTVLMLGNLANSHGLQGRWWFAGGAALGSTLWFSGLGFGARALSGRLASPRTWQLLDIAIGVVMIVVAVVLLKS